MTNCVKFGRELLTDYPKVTRVLVLQTLLSTVEW
ncbi:hypothetical protein RPYSC3_16700 [Rhodopseudomonas palustris]|nr:hypothetical protein RPYSC3_16700 [Rhodopseudomonas palustris]